ncbi:MAG TPA: response regulator transcription factor [Thermoflexia bacterium]|nr:response regulator transcription factor [Thermoflexia bacterium]
MPQTILVVDDEPQIVRLLRSYLEKSGYRVVIASNGQEALYVTRHEKPDLVVLDILMPQMDGLEFTRRVRQERDVPIIMLTARVEELDRIVGLEMGADDYITKPFSPREVVARVRAVLRRTQADSGLESTPVLRAGQLLLDREAHQATLAGAALELTPTEFDILAALLAHPGRVISRGELLETLHGVAFAAYERTIDAHIKNLRHKLGTDAGQPPYILTVRGVGYRFNQELSDA